MKPIKYIPFLIFVAFLASCSNNGNSDGHAHDATDGEEQSQDDHEAATIIHTLFSDNFELFVEFPALIAGQTSAFAAHFTRLNSYKPVKQGKVTVSIIKDGKGLRHQVDAPSSPGIFRPSLQPKEPGNYKMLFELKSDSGKVAFEIPDLKVYANPDEAAHANHLQEEGEPLDKAIIHGSLDRLNPILMTALTAALALIPLALTGDKPGNEIQSPMAVVILGGLFSSTLLNVFIVPAVYYLIKRK